MPAESAIVTTTVDHLIDCLEILEFSEEQVAATLAELVASGRVRLAGRGARVLAGAQAVGAPDVH